MTAEVTPLEEDAANLRLSPVSAQLSAYNNSQVALMAAVDIRQLVTCSMLGQSNHVTTSLKGMTWRARWRSRVRDASVAELWESRGLHDNLKMPAAVKWVSGARSAAED